MLTSVAVTQAYVQPGTDQPAFFISNDARSIQINWATLTVTLRTPTSSNSASASRGRSQSGRMTSTADVPLAAMNASGVQTNSAIKIAMSAAASCTYRGKLFSEGAAIYGDPCPGQACAALAGPRLTCRAGQWVYPNGLNVCATFKNATHSISALPQARIQYYRSLGCIGR